MPSSPASPAADARVRILAAGAAAQRFLAAFPEPPGPDFRAAERDLETSLRDLVPGDPLRAEVAVTLGLIRTVEHEKRCADPCPAPGELAPIVELLAIGGAREGAPLGQLYPYALTVDKLYDHTHDPGDIDLAITWLRRAAAHHGVSPGERRQALVCLAIQYANKGAWLREVQERSGPGTESWAAFGTAIGQFESVLAELAGRGRRSDPTRDEDRRDARLSLLETYYQRGGEDLRDEDLDVMAALARALIATVTPGYRLRSHALGRCGVVLIQRIMRRAGDSWDRALNTALLSGDPAPVREVIRAVPGFESDLAAAAGALTVAVGLENPDSRLHPLFLAAACAARGLEYLAYAGQNALAEFGRLCRLVMGHPRVTEYYRRTCAEFLLVVLERHLREAGPDLTALHRAAARLGPSGQAALDVMIGLLARFAAADGLALDPALSAALSTAVSMRAGEELSDAELAAMYARQRSAAAAYPELPALHAALLAQAAITGAERVRRGAGPAELADEVTMAFAGALRAFPPAHPIAIDLAARATEFAARRGRPSGRPATAARAAAARVPPGPRAFGIRALASPGAASHGRLAVPAGRAAEIAETLLATAPGGGRREAAVRAVLALALHTRWLRERGDDDLSRSISQLRRAIDLVPARHPLHRQLAALLTAVLLDRAWARGDQADAEAALSRLRGPDESLRPRPADEDLNLLLAQAGPAALRALLTTRDARPSWPPAGDGTPPLSTRAAIGSALLARGLLSRSAAGPLDPAANGEDRYLSEAAVLLDQVATRLPPGNPHRPDVLSDLGLALLAAGRERGTGTRRALETMERAVASCPPGHPRRASILLRTAAALAANAREAYDPQIVDRGVDLLTQALRSAGLDTYGERSRCLYGLGYTLIVRFEHDGRPADLRAAIDALEESRACLEPAPGDPFTVPLLRLLAWAHRRPGTAGSGRARTQARSVARSVLHAQAETVLLQSGSGHAVAAARSAGEDALRLAGWCLADGQPRAAVEALELGRALVLHAATVAADIPALLRDRGRPELAAEWRSGERRDLDDVPGDLRHRVLTALRDGAAERRMLAAPELPQIIAALVATRTDALVYLLPASAETDGSAVIVHADGQVRECGLPGLVAGPGSVVADFAAACRDLRASGQEADGADPLVVISRLRGQLGEVCDWAWTAAVGPVLDVLTAAAAQPAPVRLCVVPFGVLSIVPWPAARRTAGGQARYACSEAVFTTCASARQLIEAAARPRLPVSARSAVFVVDPSGDLRWAAEEAASIRSALYPGSACLGQPGPSGAGPDEVLACFSADGPRGVLPGVLHLGCHASAEDTPERSRLRLAGGDLRVDRILAQARTRAPGSPGGLVVLAACTSDLTLTDFDEALTLSSAFLAAGAAGVVGSRWEVDDLNTALLMFMLHRHLVRHPGESPADALRAAQLWMLDPRREAPAEMPAPLAGHARRLSVPDPLAWAAFTYHGQ